MKRKLQILAALVAILAMSACGDKDPLSKQPDWVKTAKPGIQKPETPGLDERDFIIAATPTFFGFVEGRESSGTIHAAVLKEGFTVEVAAENLGDFDKATFQKVGADYVFTWTPPQNYVPTSEPVNTNLHVCLNAVDVTQVPRHFCKDIPMLVTADRGAPVIDHEEGFPTQQIREGDVNEFTIVVRDTEEQSGTPVAPQLRFEPSPNSFGNSVNIADCLQAQPPTQDVMNPHLWRFDVTLDLREKNLVKDLATGVFRVIAVSKSMIESPIREYTVKLIPNVLTPQTSISPGDELRASIGKHFQQDILFIDPAQKGRMEAESTTRQLPAGLSVTCNPSPSFSWMAVCTLAWDLPANAQPATYDLSLKGRNNSPVQGDNKTAETDLNFTVRVVL